MKIQKKIFFGGHIIEEEEEEESHLFLQMFTRREPASHEMI